MYSPSGSVSATDLIYVTTNTTLTSTAFKDKRRQNLSVPPPSVTYCKIAVFLLLKEEILYKNQLRQKGLSLILKAVAVPWYSCLLPESSRFHVPVEILTHNQDCPAEFHCSDDVQLLSHPWINMSDVQHSLIKPHGWFRIWRNNQNWFYSQVEHN